jgi:hypothetical protein
MRTLEAVGASLLGGGLTGVAITGFVLYLASHGVQPVPNPTLPGSVNDTPERREFFTRYNARYVAVVRVLRWVSLTAGVLGLALLIVGAVA